MSCTPWPELNASWDAMAFTWLPRSSATSPRIVLSRVPSAMIPRRSSSACWTGTPAGGGAVVTPPGGEVSGDALAGGPGGATTGGPTDPPGTGDVTAGAVPAGVLAGPLDAPAGVVTTGAA